MKYFEDEVNNGNWDAVEKYLSGFSEVDDNSDSMKIFFKIRKQKYLEALDKHDRSKAVDILAKDLKIFATFNEELFKEIAQLSTLENFGENEQLSKYGDTKSARAIMSVELKNLIEANPLFSDKLQFPNLKGSRLQTLINQGLNWQHLLCKNPIPNPVIKTLYVDNSCGQPNRARAPSPANNPLLGIKEGAVTMTSLTKELVFLILQFLDEEKFKETMHRLEQESGVFFNMKYFEDEVNNGNWDEVEKYLSGFTKVEDNSWSMKIFFEIRKQRYLEALDKHDQSQAVDILVKDLNFFATFDEELSEEIAQFSTLENFRGNEQLSKYGNTKSARAIMSVERRKLIEANPLFSGKLQFPNIKRSRLKALINQGLNWQHHFCKNPWPNPVIETLYVDHSCGQPNRARAPSPANNPLLGSLPKAGGCPPLGAHEVNLPVNMLPVTFPGHSHGQALNAADNLPKNVIRTLNQGSSPMSMDFHPSQQTLLLVGTNVGDIGLWEVGSRGRLVLRNFKVWDLSSCSMLLQAALVKDPGVSVNRVIWSPDGALFGVAYSRHIVQIYSYHGGDDVREHLEIDAHVGGVNDLAFSHPNEQLCVITCGDDKTIKVWDATTGAKQYTFEGHEAPVYSVCPHYKENIQFILSTAMDGKIKAWEYDKLGSRVDYDTPGRWCTTMAYSGDGTRLFSCGTSEDGESDIVEWNESERAVKRTYKGLRKRSFGVVQFGTTKNRFLAAGDDFSIKFWDMDNIQLLTTADADGGLPASPRIRLNKDGTLLAASANENGIKVLANADGMRLLRTIENHLSYDNYSDQNLNSL